MSSLDQKYDVTVSEFSNKPKDPSKYNETLKNLCTISSIGELSYILHHIVSFNDSPPFNINIFKSGITASWEDEANLSGCSWNIQFKCESSNLIFERLAIYFVMQGFQTFHCNGISANVRKNYVKFSIWSRNVPSVSEGSDVIDELKSAVGLDSTVEFAYKNHKQLLEKVASENYN